jgi:hypothetical protein
VEWKYQMGQAVAPTAPKALADKQRFNRARLPPSEYQ